MAHRIVVVGYGLAAHRFVTRLLESDADLDVTVYAGDLESPYDRTRLPEVVAGRVPAAAVILPALSDPRLHILHGVRAIALDRMHRLVHSSDHWVARYDTLVLATGADPVLPPIRGLRDAEDQTLLPGVHSIHTLDDIRALTQAAATASRAVVIGGGATGLRIAEALHTTRTRDPRRLPLHIDLVAQSPSPREITPADAFSPLHRTGITTHQDTRVRTLEEGPTGALTAAVLSTNHRIPCDLAVLACGTTPNVALAWTSGLAVARGIVIDDALRSVTDPHIHALGACTEHRRTLPADPTATLTQAEVLADRLSGRDIHRTYLGAGALVTAGTAVAA